MNCQSCGQPLAPDARFCPACGTPTAAACRSCGAPLPADARFCPACGAPTGAGERAAAGAAAGRERKVATIVFADIVGYTGITEGHDPELVQAVVGRAFDRLSAEIARYEGLVEKFAGDALLALFGVPQAHEDDPERAVRAALEMNTALAEVAADERARGRPELQLRIGIETGEVLVDLRRAAGERDRMVTGDPVNTAARLQAAAAPGTIVVGPGTYAGTRDLVEYEELPPLELKGKSLPIPAWRAVRVKARRGGQRSPLGLEAPLIGRDEELGLLKETVRRMAAEGRPHVVTVLGAAGVGKSRLAWELEKYLDGLPETFHWRKGRCLSYGQPSFGGLIDVVRADIHVRDDDSEDAVRSKLGARLEQLGQAGDRQVEQALAVLLGLSTEATPGRDDLFEGWRRYLEAIARVAPLVVVLEDIHWADEGSLEFLDFVARWAEAPILLLCLARHELFERRPNWGGGVANSASIVLEPLAPAENARLLDALLPGPLPPNVRQRIVDVAEGNPLFSEELVRMLIDRGAARRVDGGWELVAPIEALDVPRSIHALLAARLDSLPAPEKRITQAAAVVGRIFWDAVLAHVVAGASIDLDRLLRGLRVKELVVPREPSSLAEAREYGFRHVLIRDVAYDSVPKVERAEKHLQVASWAEQRLGEREEELVELLASHYRSALAYREEAGAANEAELAVLRRMVLDSARRAGRRARELWQGAAASGWFRLAFEQAAHLQLPPLEQAVIALDYLDVALATERPEDALRVAEPVADLVAPLTRADPQARDVLARLQTYIGYFMYELGRAAEARSLLEDALREVEGGPPTEARARLLWRLGWLSWRAFSPPDAIPLLERAVADARALGIADAERMAVHDLGIALHQSGRVTEGLALLERSLEMARSAGDGGLLMRCYTNLSAMMSGVVWDVDRAHAIAREGLERARRGGHRFFVTFIALNLAEGAADEGKFDEAMALIDEARELAYELGNESLISMTHSFLGGVNARFGRLEEAVEHWAEAERHGTAEPQGAGRAAGARALSLVATDPRAAVSLLAREVTGVREQIVARWLAAMAVRTGQTDEAREAIAQMPLVVGTPRLEAEAAWREALLGPPTSEAAAIITAVADRYLAEGLRLIAADGFADAALVARRAGAPGADELQRRADELYRQSGAKSVLDVVLSAQPSAAISPAATG